MGTTTEKLCQLSIENISNLLKMSQNVQGPCSISYRLVHNPTSVTLITTLYTKYDTVDFLGVEFLTC